MSKKVYDIIALKPDMLSAFSLLSSYMQCVLKHDAPSVYTTNPYT